MKPQQIKANNALIHEENIKNLVIYFTKYVNCKSIKMLSLHFYKLMGKTEEHEEKIFNGWSFYGQ